MGKVILNVAISLDGYIAGADDKLDWLDAFESGDYSFSELIESVGAIVMGRLVRYGCGARLV